MVKLLELIQIVWQIFEVFLMEYFFFVLKSLTELL